MRVATGTIFYQALPELQRLYACVVDHVDVLYMVDGIFSVGDKSDPDLSTDGSREWLKKQKKVRLIDAPRLMQADKRNVYMEAAEKDGCDFIIALDSDIHLKGLWWMFSKELEKMQVPAARMPVYNFTVGQWYFGYTASVFRPSLVRYHKRHDHQSDRVGQLLVTKQMPIINGLLKVNDHTLRSRERQLKGGELKGKNRQKELGRSK